MLQRDGKKMTNDECKAFDLGVEYQRKKEGTHPYTVGPNMMLQIFHPLGMSDLSDMQAILDQVERRLEPKKPRPISDNALQENFRSNATPLWREIFDALRTHELSNMMDPDQQGYYPLVDRLSRDGGGVSIADGEEEIASIVDLVHEIIAKKRELVYDQLTKSITTDPDKTLPNLDHLRINPIPVKLEPEQGFADLIELGSDGWYWIDDSGKRNGPFETPAAAEVQGKVYYAALERGDA